ncbi:MAG: hypothetical protein SGCHY_003341 [Lobulomycetales sp.]
MGACSVAETPHVLHDLATNLALFSTGALVMRSAGCTINDMLDFRLDRRVARTAGRPLASGALTPTHAFVFLSSLLSGGLYILTRLDALSIGLGVVSVPLVLAYPLMKRYTYFPQVFLGMTMSWGVWIGWTAMTHTLPPLLSSGVLPLYLAGVCWSVFYDTVYALQDVADDVSVGVKSTAVYLLHPPLASGPITAKQGDERVYRFLAASAGGMVLSLATAGMAGGMGAAYYGIGVCGAGLHMAWLLRGLRVRDVASAKRVFGQSVWTGVAVFVGIVADLFLWHRPKAAAKSDKPQIDASDKIEP